MAGASLGSVTLSRDRADESGRAHQISGVGEMRTNLPMGALRGIKARSAAAHRHAESMPLA